MQPKKNGVYNGKAFSYENKQYNKLTEEEKDFLNNYIIKKLMWGSNEKQQEKYQLNHTGCHKYMEILQK